MTMISRIYQGRIISACFADKAFRGGKADVLQALSQTHRLFQDAVNYHIVALAGMAEAGDATIAGKFRGGVKDIWEENPRGEAGACTLQQSVCRTLGLENASFEEAVSAIFDGCERPDVLPYLLHYAIDKTRKGASAVQQEGRGMLPKFCNPLYSGSFDFSVAGRAATKGLNRLQGLLNADELDSRLPELQNFAREMDLSWANIKTRSGEYWNEAETYVQIQAEMAAMLQMLEAREDVSWKKLEEEQGRNLAREAKEALAGIRPDVSHLLAKNRKVSPALKRAAIFYIYYPCKVSAELLRTKLGKRKEKGTNAADSGAYDYSLLENDPFILARGKRGYVFPGFTALPCWETEEGRMYEKEWDILAFKEALKALHGFELKMSERQKEREELEERIKYMETGEGKAGEADDVQEEETPVLGGDFRYDLLCNLVRSLKLDEEDSEYSLSVRALKGFGKLRSKWEACLRKGDCSTAELQEIVRDTQAQGGDFGSQLLFHCLCEEQYRPIWQADSPRDGLPRSKDILRDFGSLQEMKRDAERLNTPVRLTAAEPRVSPRMLMYSDLTNLGPKAKGCQFAGQGKIRLRVVAKNHRDRWVGATVEAVFSSPRLVRDQLGEDHANWPSKTKTGSVSWLQPMMAALGIDSLPKLEKAPAVALEIFLPRDGEEPVCLLNFPVSLDVEPLQKAIGAAEIWAMQFNGPNNEKLHLHWPATRDKIDKKTIPWWERPSLKESGFEVLGIDLGVRYAAAWSLTHVEAKSEHDGLSCPAARFLGNAGNADWYGRSVCQGLIRINGENQAGRGEDASPDATRQATAEEKELIQNLYNAWNLPLPSMDGNIQSLNNGVLRVFRRLLSRYRKHLQFYASIRGKEAPAKTLEDMKRYFCNSKDEQKRREPEIWEALENGNLKRVEALLWDGVRKIRAELPFVAEQVANLILPRRRGCWKWHPRKKLGFIGSGIMLPTGDEPHGKEHHLYRMGGLSVGRLTQLEELRKRLQSMNRLLAVTPGEKALSGRASRNVPVLDPCPDIRLKIENVRTARVNEIAHAIVAQALGVRLVKPARQGKNADGRDVFHGEYERIPGRRPVSFVILENLHSYRTNVANSRAENATLMLWSHQHVAAKVVQLLEEVFGIPVLFVHAAYTSKFDSVTSAPGFRADAMTLARLKAFCKDEIGNEKIARAYADCLAAIPRKASLYMPSKTNSGEYFISCSRDGDPAVRNADINAAVNIAWRALASPTEIALLHCVRLEKGAKVLRLVQNNKREKSRDKKSLSVEGGIKLDNGVFNAFYGEKADVPPIARLGDIPLCYGKEMWGRLKWGRWGMCHRLNLRILRKMGIQAPDLEMLADEEDDDIPC